MIRRSTPTASIEILVAIALIIPMAIAGCAPTESGDPEDEEEMTAKTIQEVLNERTDEWMSIPGVVGTGIGECEGEPCIRIFVVKKTSELMQKLPSEVEGYAVDVQESGEFQALDPP